MKTKKRKYLSACLEQSVEWLMLSASNQSVCMTKTEIKLHYLAIRIKNRGFKHRKYNELHCNTD